MMPNFEEMYFTLFREMEKAIRILQEAHQRTEEMYLSENGKTEPAVQKTKENCIKNLKKAVESGDKL